jgi:hypothetical protein
VRVAVVVASLEDGLVGSEGCADEAALTRLDTGGVADGRILEAFGHVLASRAALDAVVAFSVPDAAVVPQAALFVVVSGFATAFADTGEVPFAASVGFAGGGVGIQGGVLTFGEALALARVPRALVVSFTLSFDVDDGADGLAHAGFELASWVAETFSDVVDQVALLVALVVEGIEAARRVVVTSS